MSRQMRTKPQSYFDVRPGGGGGSGSTADGQATNLSYTDSMGTTPSESSAPSTPRTSFSEERCEESTTTRRTTTATATPTPTPATATAPLPPPMAMPRPVPSRQHTGTNPLDVMSRDFPKPTRTIDVAVQLALKPRPWSLRDTMSRPPAPRRPVTGKSADEKRREVQDAKRDLLALANDLRRK